MKHLIIFSAVFILVTSCSEESSLFDPTYFGEGFKGITFTLEDGPEPIKEDPSDWCYNFRENLNKIEGETGVEDIPLGYSFYPAYPNPVTLGRPTTLGFALPQESNVYLYIINNDYKIIRVLINSVLAAGRYEVMLDTNGIGITGVFRVVFEIENFYCKGDIWLK